MSPLKIEQIGWAYEKYGIQVTAGWKLESPAKKPPFREMQEIFARNKEWDSPLAALPTEAEIEELIEKAREDRVRFEENN